MNIKSFNKKNNKSYDQVAAFDAWEDYRLKVSSYIKPLLKNESRVLIIGAGACNDLNLEIFSECQVTFLDIDIDSVELGLKKQNFSNYKLIEDDILGLDKTPFMAKLSNGMKKKKIKPIFSSFREQYNFELDEIYDLIIILPIYTQLLLPQLYASIMKSDTLIQETMQFIAERIQYFHATIHEALEDSGQIIAFSDLLEYDRKTEEAAYLLAHKDHSIILAKHYEDYLASYGHGLGSYGLLDLAEEMLLQNEDYFIWPFSEDRLLLVKGNIYKKSQP